MGAEPVTRKDGLRASDASSHLRSKTVGESTGSLPTIVTDLQHAIAHLGQGNREASTRNRDIVGVRLEEKNVASRFELFFQMTHEGQHRFFGELGLRESEKTVAHLIR